MNDAANIVSEPSVGGRAKEPNQTAQDNLIEKAPNLEWVRCGRCFANPDPIQGTLLFVTNCGHFVCHKCREDAPMTPPPATATPKRKPGDFRICHDCKKASSVVRLEKGHPISPEIMFYFNSPVSILKKLHDIEAFQDLHRTRRLDFQKRNRMYCVDGDIQDRLDTVTEDQVFSLSYMEQLLEDFGTAEASEEYLLSNEDALVEMLCELSLEPPPNVDNELASEVSEEVNLLNSEFEFTLSEPESGLQVSPNILAHSPEALGRLATPNTLGSPGFRFHEGIETPEPPALNFHVGTGAPEHPGTLTPPSTPGGPAFSFHVGTGTLGCPGTPSTLPPPSTPGSPAFSFHVGTGTPNTQGHTRTRHHKTPNSLGRLVAPNSLGRPGIPNAPASPGFGGTMILSRSFDFHKEIGTQRSPDFGYDKRAGTPSTLGCPALDLQDGTKSPPLQGSPAYCLHKTRRSPNALDHTRTTPTPGRPAISSQDALDHTRTSPTPGRPAISSQDETQSVCLSPSPPWYQNYTQYSGHDRQTPAKPSERNLHDHIYDPTLYEYPTTRDNYSAAHESQPSYETTEGDYNAAHESQPSYETTEGDYNAAHESQPSYETTEGDYSHYDAAQTEDNQTSYVTVQDNGKIYYITQEDYDATKGNYQGYEVIQINNQSCDTIQDENQSYEAIQSDNPTIQDENEVIQDVYSETVQLENQTYEAIQDNDTTIQDENQSYEDEDQNHAIQDEGENYETIEEESSSCQDRDYLHPRSPLSTYSHDKSGSTIHQFLYEPRHTKHRKANRFRREHRTLLQKVLQNKFERRVAAAEMDDQPDEDIFDIFSDIWPEANTKGTPPRTDTANTGQIEK